MANNFCDDCCYYKKTGSGAYRYCDYFFATNQRRPCPPGEGCTVKVGMKVNRRKKKGDKTNG